MNALPMHAPASPHLLTSAHALSLSTGMDLNATQTQQAQALAQQLCQAHVNEVHAFGQGAGEAMTAFSDELLTQMRHSDLDVMGAKLGDIVSTAQGLNVHGFSNQRSKIPVLGAMLDKLKQRKNDFVRQFEGVRTQIEQLMSEVDTMQQGLVQRVQVLDEAFEGVRAEHDELAIHIHAGTLALAQMESEWQTPATPLTPLQAQAQQDRRHAAQVLDKRIADLRMLQQAALQQLPMIRMVQANNRMLVDKFHSIRTLTIPTWKRQFMLAVALNEQQNAVKMAQTVDDATNQFMKENARLLHENTVASARANQRLVIDIDTLQTTHDQLIATVQAVMQINREGAQQRQAAMGALQQLRGSVLAQLAGTGTGATPPSPPALHRS